MVDYVTKPSMSMESLGFEIISLQFTRISCKFLIALMFKNITFNAEATLIEKARLQAKKEQRTLNELFKEWLARYTKQHISVKNYNKLMKKLRYVHAGRQFSREEMNER